MQCFILIIGCHSFPYWYGIYYTKQNKLVKASSFYFFNYIYRYYILLPTFFLFLKIILHCQLFFLFSKIVIVVGAKLEVIITKMCVESCKNTSVVPGRVLVQLNDDLFWFGRPRWLLHLIQLVLIQVYFNDFY